MDVGREWLIKAAAEKFGDKFLAECERVFHNYRDLLLEQGFHHPVSCRDEEEEGEYSHSVEHGCEKCCFSVSGSFYTTDATTRTMIEFAVALKFMGLS
jgi:hypothetical protein